MIRTILFRPEATDEVLSARIWYEEQSPGLGSEFADAIDEAVNRISANPQAFPIVHNNTRRIVIRRFPYGVYFRVSGDEIVVIAVMHGRRHPRRWQQRS